DRRQHPRVVERHAAAIMQLPATEEMVEPQPADAERMPTAKLGRRHVGTGGRYAPQPAGLARQRIEHRGVVGSVALPCTRTPRAKPSVSSMARYFSSGASGGV